MSRERLSVSALKGCGVKRAQQLREVGIESCQDLLDYRGPDIPGINLTSLKEKARHVLGVAEWQVPLPAAMVPAVPPSVETTPPAAQHTEAKGGGPPSTIRHAWYGLPAHMMKDQHFWRVKVGELMIAPCGVLLVCHSGRQVWPCTPTALLMYNVLWVRRDVISDNDDDDEVMQLGPPQALPTWAVEEDTWQLTVDQRTALCLSNRETCQMQELSLLFTH